MCGNKARLMCGNKARLMCGNRVTARGVGMSGQIVRKVQKSFHPFPDWVQPAKILQRKSAR